MRIQLKWQFTKTRTRHTYQFVGDGPFFQKSDPVEVPTAENAGPVPLGVVAECTARAKATEGGVPLDQHTYEDKTRHMVRWLVDDARAGRIHLVDGMGRPGTFDEILERARKDGVFCDAWSNPAATETEKNFSYGLVLFSTLDSINAWAATVGDEFYIDAPEQAAATSESLTKPMAITGRDHVSDKLAKLNQAAAKFWANADREDRATHPTNASVAAWLLERGYSQSLADKAVSIIRPEWAPTGRKPEE